MAAFLMAVHLPGRGLVILAQVIEGRLFCSAFAALVCRALLPVPETKSPAIKTGPSLISSQSVKASARRPLEAKHIHGTAEHHENHRTRHNKFHRVLPLGYTGLSASIL